MHFYCFLLLLLCSTIIQAAPKVVVSIKPIHSLVSGVMQGVAKPMLLMESSQSLHHYSLKPSDLRQLAKADLIFWVGPELESFMPQILKNLNNNTQIITLIKSKNLTKLPLRQIHNRHDDSQLRTDGHIWMNTHNADVLVDEITQHLTNIDSDNARTYRSNQIKLHEEINALREELHLSLNGISKPFLNYHDAYQYFESEFKLNNSGFVTSNIDISPGARRILDLKKIIKRNSIQCLFYNAPIKPAIIDTLLADSNIKAIELDPTGIYIKESSQTWFMIMQTMGKSLKSCLQSN